VNEFASLHPILAVALPKILVLLFVLLTSLAYLTWFERKVVAHIQARWGPYRVGPHGLLQPLADGLKFLFKEDVTPAGADKFVYFLAPFLAMSLAITSIAVIPFGPKEFTVFGQPTMLAITNLNIGLLILFAITSMGVYGVALAGWSSNSKYPLLGGLRSSAQMVSYELALTMSVVGVILMAGTFNLSEIVQSQQGFHWGIVPRWNLIGWPMPQIFLGFPLFFTAAVAETNRAPFDLAEAESELVAGFHTEYASFKFAMFFMAEYASMITVSCLATILFFGGWLSPFPQTTGWAWTHYIPTAAFGLAGLALIIHGVRYLTMFGRIVLPFLGVVLCALAALFAKAGVLEFVQGPFWFLLKIAFFLFIYVWVRGTLPRFRYDQLMGFGWKLLLPLSILNVVITSLAIVLTQR
jgi:NADH-quinone oxidoreductase subunit H